MTVMKIFPFSIDRSNGDSFNMSAAFAATEVSSSHDNGSSSFGTITNPSMSASGGGRADASENTDDDDDVVGEMLWDTAPAAQAAPPPVGLIIQTDCKQSLNQATANAASQQFQQHRMEE